MAPATTSPPESKPASTRSKKPKVCKASSRQNTYADTKLVDLVTQTNPILSCSEVVRRASKLKAVKTRRWVQTRLKRIGKRNGDDTLATKLRHTGLRWARIRVGLYFDPPGGWDGSLEELPEMSQEELERLQARELNVNGSHGNTVDRANQATEKESDGENGTEGAAIGVKDGAASDIALRDGENDGRGKVDPSIDLTLDEDKHKSPTVEPQEKRATNKSHLIADPASDSERTEDDSRREAHGIEDKNTDGD